MQGRQTNEPEKPAVPAGLRDAVREARIEAAERSAVVVDLRDAELARLELLNEKLDPLFREIPSDIELFDRGISRGDVPRLWIDVVAHIEMGRDKRMYRFVQDTRYGRKVLAESYDVPELVAAVTKYVARRLVEREQALAGDTTVKPLPEVAMPPKRRGGFWRGVRIFIFGVLVGIGALVALALSQPHP